MVIGRLQFDTWVQRMATPPAAVAMLRTLLDHAPAEVRAVVITGSGAPQALTLASFIALCSAALAKPVQSQLAVLGDMSLGGTIVQVRNLAESMQVAFDAGAKRILLPMSSVTDIPSVPGELFAKFQTSFYSDPVDAVFKALGVE